MQRLEKKREKKKNFMGALLPAAKKRLGIMGKSVISHFSSFRAVKTSAMLYATGTKYKLFSAFEEVENYEEGCKPKQNTVSSTGYKWDVSQTFYTKTLAPKCSQFRQVAPLISVWQESGKLQCLRIMIKSEQSHYKMIGLKSLRV